MTNILCIGASTYNTGTPQKIMDAMIKTNFLQDWAVIIAIHKYLRLYKHNLEHNLEEHKTYVSSGFDNYTGLTLIDSAKSYVVEKGKIYVLPDSLWCNPPAEGIYIEISASNNAVSIHASHSIVVREEELANLADKDNLEAYLPAINRVMDQVANSCPNKVAGLILAGKGKDGAEGLLAIKNHRGVTAVQNPCECFRSGTEGTDSMPSNALQFASNQGVNHEIISLENTAIKTLADWFDEIK